MRSLVLSLFSTNKNKKMVKIKIYIYRVVYTAQMKARQALDKPTKFVKKMIYIYRVVYTAQTKARQALDRSRKFVKTTVCIYRVVYTAQMKARQVLDKKVCQDNDLHIPSKTSRQRRHQQKIKNLHSKRSIVSYYRSWSTKVNYIKHCHQEKKYQY